jgi:hypothetical protein
MAAAEQYAQWIFDNKDKKGTAEFKKVANAYQAAKYNESKLDYSHLESQKAANDATRAALQEESWLSRNLKGAATAPSNLYEGAKQLFSDLQNPQEYINPRTGETSSSPIQGYQALPRQQYDTSQIKQNRIIAEEAPVGAIAGNIATAAPLAFIPAANRTIGSSVLGGIYSALQPTLGQESRLENLGTGAFTSALVPNAPRIAAPILGSAANRLMQSAIKPQTKYLEAGRVPAAIETMFEYGVNPTQGRTIFGKGLDVIKKDVARLNSLIDDIVRTSPNVAKTNTALAEIERLRPQIIATGGDVTELDALTKFITQKQANPLLSGEFISVPAAQEMKKGINKKIGESAYLKDATALNLQGEKALARGLRQAIMDAAPEVAPLNALESKALNALKVSERKALNEANKDIMGLGSISPSVTQALLFLADRNAGMKSIVARMLNQAKIGVQAIPTPANKGLIGIPAASAVTSYNQLNTTPSLLD